MIKIEIIDRPSNYIMNADLKLVTSTFSVSSVNWKFSYPDAKYENICIYTTSYNGD
jgi:hypothetical protein